MLHCHVSLLGMDAHMLIQCAHILVPKATPVNDNLLTMYEWILGMGYRTLCKNSRLFLMPCELYVGLPLSSLIPNRFQSSTVFIAFSTTTYALYSPPIRLWIKYRLTWAWSQWCEFGLTEIYGWCFEEVQ
ncbi:hypothetical protein GGU11DRAFT_812757 [Lentinula aff. detonsa]|nr:hypothetical protein GGU11DRAFT_812757 [Lentinula aff. detonsa]